MRSHVRLNKHVLVSSGSWSCFLMEEHSMDQYRSRQKLSENFECHWSIQISGEIRMDQSLVHTSSWGNSCGLMVLKVLLKFPPTLALVHGWLFPIFWHTRAYSRSVNILRQYWEASCHHPRNALSIHPSYRDIVHSLVGISAPKKKKLDPPLLPAPSRASSSNPHPPSLYF